MYVVYTSLARLICNHHMFNGVMIYYRHGRRKFKRSALNVYSPKTLQINRITSQYISDGFDINKNQSCVPRIFKRTTHFLHHTFFFALSLVLSSCKTRNIVIPISSPKICVTLCFLFPLVRSFYIAS